MKKLTSLNTVPFPKEKGVRVYIDKKTKSRDKFEKAIKSVFLSGNGEIYSSNTGPTIITHNRWYFNLEMMWICNSVLFDRILEMIKNKGHYKNYTYKWLPTLQDVKMYGTEEEDNLPQTQSSETLDNAFRENYSIVLDETAANYSDTNITSNMEAIRREVSRLMQ